MGGAERVLGTWRWASRAFRDLTGSLSTGGADLLITTDLQDGLAADFGVIAFDTSVLEESLRYQAATLMLQRQSGEGGRGGRGRREGATPGCDTDAAEAER